MLNKEIPPSVSTSSAKGRLAFGTYRLRGARAAAEVRAALERGIRHIDTARLYKNEDEVYGEIRAFEAENPGTSKIFVTSKIFTNAPFEETVRAVEDSVRRLGRPLDRVLLHRPLPHVQWRALDACVASGLVGEIGVSNYPVERLASLLTICRPASSKGEASGTRLCRRPAVLQTEFHPFVGAVHPLLSYCRAEDISVQGHTMLARGNHLTFPPLVRIARSYGLSPAVAMLAWARALGVELLVHTSQTSHLDELIAAFGEAASGAPPLSERDLAEISGFHCTLRQRFFMDPPPPAPEAELDRLTDSEAYIAEIVRRLQDDRAALLAGKSVSRTALELPTQTARQILTDPTANRIALSLFPLAETGSPQSSYDRYRGLLRNLRSASIAEKTPVPKQCQLPADHPARGDAPRIVKGRPISAAVEHPRAMPVEVAPAAELEPFFQFLEDPQTFMGDAPSAPMTFPRGTYFPDDRMDLCKQVVGPASIGALCDAVARSHTREPSGQPLTFVRGTYFPDQRMDLCKQVVGPTHIGRLCDAIEAHATSEQSREDSRRRVRHFLLGNNIACDGPSTAGAEALGRLMAHPKVAIETWYLAGNCIGPDDLKILAEALHENRHAKALWLKRNPIGARPFAKAGSGVARDGGPHSAGAAGAAALGRLLGENSTLELLDLHNTALFDEGIEALRDGFLAAKKPLALKHLYLSGNGLTERSLAPLGDVLRAHPDGLVSLYLSLNRLGNEAIPELVRLLASGALANLERLDLGAVGFVAPCLDPLVDALLAHCPRLRSLDLGTYRSTRDLGETPNDLAADVPALRRLLAKPSLELLDLSICGLTDEDGEALVADLVGKGDSPTLRPSVQGIAYGDSKSAQERRFLKHDARVLHIDSIYRGRA